jgi:hypothetical protein
MKLLRIDDFPVDHSSGEFWDQMRRRNLAVAYNLRKFGRRKEALGYCDRARSYRQTHKRFYDVHNLSH